MLTIIETLQIIGYPYPLKLNLKIVYLLDPQLVIATAVVNSSIFRVSQ